MSPLPTPQHHPSLLSVDTATVHDTVEVIHARGAIDLLTGPELERCIEVALDKAPSAVVVDLTDVDFLASFGMSILLRTNDRLTQETPLVVVADGPATSRPMEILGLTDVLTIHGTLQAALESLHPSP
jgi:anti-sigma B factor antagonist